MARTRDEIDMLNGPITGKLIRFALPLIFSGMLQLLFNAADVIVVGNFCGSNAMAAVGSNGSVINLIINLFMGVSVGTNVVVARAWGRQHADSVFRTVHSAILLSVIVGLMAGAAGLIAAPQILQLMSVPEEILPLSTEYLRIYFLGIPATVVYNFGAAILRAIGDTKRPMYFLTAAGILNVVCNLILVILFDLGVAGVAIASAASQYLAAILVLRCLTKKENSCRLSFRKLHLYREETLEMIRIGIPAGLQGTIFDISNVLIQSSVNGFGATFVAGNVAASNLCGLIYTGMNAFYHAAVSFTSQNVGAGKPERLPRILLTCYALVASIGVFAGGLLNLFGSFFLGLYNRDAAVIAAGIIRLRWVGLPYFLCGMMEVGCGFVRGTGRAWLPMIVSLLGSCAFRIIWIYTVFAANPTPGMLFISYPISWLITWGAHTVCAVDSIRRMRVLLTPKPKSDMPAFELPKK